LLRSSTEGTLVTAAIYRSPGTLIKTATTLDVLSGGRLMVGVGSGSSPREYERLGVPMGGRHGRFQEGIDILLRAWTGEEFSYQGRKVQVTPTPVTPAAGILFVGGSGKPAARRAAHHSLKKRALPA